MKASALGFKHVVVTYDVFRCEFEVIVGPKKNVAKYAAFHHDDVANEGSYEIDDQRGRFFFRKGYAPIIWLPRVPRTPSEIETLVHEVGHAVIDMLDYLGHPINSDTSEVFCYAHGYGVRKVLEALRGR